jgi:hypothetical protein
MKFLAQTESERPTDRSDQSKSYKIAQGTGGINLLSDENTDRGGLKSHDRLTGLP